MRQLPTKIKVSYSRSHRWALSKVPGAIWEYHIEEANGDVYGFAGGVLTKNGFGEWVAHYWEHAVGVPSATRERAIMNVLPFAAQIVDDYAVQKKKNEAAHAERVKAADFMRSFFPRTSGLVTIQDINTTPEKSSGEPRFKVVMQFDNLTEAQVILLAAKQPRS